MTGAADRRAAARPAAALRPAVGRRRRSVRRHLQVGRRHRRAPGAHGDASRPVYLVNRRGGRAARPPARTRRCSRSPRDARAGHPRDAGGRVRRRSSTRRWRSARRRSSRSSPASARRARTARARERAAARASACRGRRAARPELHGARRSRQRASQAVAYLDIPPGDVGVRVAERRHGRGVRRPRRAPGAAGSRATSRSATRRTWTSRRSSTAFADHAPTRVVAVYAGGRSATAAAAPPPRRAVVAAGRPVVLLAPGRSAAGARAARSHTGVAGSRSDGGVDAVCARRRRPPRRDAARAVRADDGAARRRRGRADAAWRSISDGGGPGGVAADALDGRRASPCPAFGAALAAAVCARRCPGAPAPTPSISPWARSSPTRSRARCPLVAGADEVDAVVRGRASWATGRRAFPSSTSSWRPR